VVLYRFVLGNPMSSPGDKFSMARKPSDVVQYKLRIREELRRRLEHAAKKRGVSVNYEMAARLKESFDREELLNLGRIRSDMETQWTRWSEALFQREQQGGLMKAAEVLIGLLAKPAADRESIEKATAQVEKATKAIRLHAEASARGPGG
jgi:hypothetical protein